MTRILLIAALVLALPALAGAAGPDDMKAASAALKHQDYDAAARLYAKALAGGDLSLEEQAQAHNNRAVAFTRQRQYENAIAELDAAIKLKPDNGFYYYYRGHAAFYLGRFAPAAADFAHTLVLDPRQRYSLIWLHLARAEAGEDDARELAANAERVNGKSWPAPVIDLFLGKLGPADLQKAARTGRKADRFAKACETAFYLGLYHREHGAPQDAARELAEAAKTCPDEWVEHAGAEAALRWAKG